MLMYLLYYIPTVIDMAQTQGTNISTCSMHEIEAMKFAESCVFVLFIPWCYACPLLALQLLVQVDDHGF